MVFCIFSIITNFNHSFAGTSVYYFWTIFILFMACLVAFFIYLLISGPYFFKIFGFVLFVSFIWSLLLFAILFAMFQFFQYLSLSTFHAWFFFTNSHKYCIILLFLFLWCISLFQIFTCFVYCCFFVIGQLNICRIVFLIIVCLLV